MSATGAQRPRVRSVPASLIFRKSAKMINKSQRQAKLSTTLMADVIEVPHMTVSIFASVNGGLVNSSDYEVEATPPALNLMPPALASLAGHVGPHCPASRRRSRRLVRLAGAAAFRLGLALLHRPPEQTRFIRGQNSTQMLLAGGDCPTVNGTPRTRGTPISSADCPKEWPRTEDLGP